MNYNKNRFGIYIVIILSLFMNDLTVAGGKPHYNVVEYGAIADGQTLNTKAIQQAIDDCSENGGGTVEFPAGTYLTGTLFLKSNVFLNLQAGSTLLGSKNLEDYPQSLRQPGNNSDKKFVLRALIRGDELENVGITGFGIIDGQGKFFYGIKVRPRLLLFVSCKNVTVAGVALQHPGAWTQHYLKCDGVTIRDIKVYAHGGENNDMVDIDQSRNVIITGLIGDSDDDGITLKSPGEGLVENVVISDCIIRTRTNAIKCGTESFGGFRDITITNCVIGPSETKDGFSGANEGFAGIALEIVDGGLMENVVISNITIEKTTAPIFIRLGNRATKYSNLNSRPIGSINNVSISNIIARNAGKTGCSIVGEIGHPIKNISISNVKINFVGGGTLAEGLAEKPELINEYPECVRLGTLPAYGFFVRHVDGLTFRDVDLSYNKNEHRPALVFNDVKNLKVYNFDAELANDALGQLVLQNTQDVFINGCSPTSSHLFLRLEQNCQNINVTGNNFSKINKSVFIDDTIKTDDLNISSNLTGQSSLFEILQPNIKRDSVGMTRIYYPNEADIYYTTDGTNPTKSSKKYVKAFEQSSPIVIKAVAFKGDNTSGTAKLELKRLSVLPPHIFPRDQFFNEKMKVRLTSTTKDADIYYTTDGTAPDKLSLKYKGPIIIRDKSHLRAIAIKEGLVPSEISASKYEPIEKVKAVQFKYYEGRWVELPNFINLTPKSAGATNMFTLDGLTYSDHHFGFVMHGYVNIKTKGDYTFFAASNDGSKLFVDNIEIVNNDGAHGVTEKSGSVYLKKGIHLVEVRYFQSGGGTGLKVSWSGPGFEKREMTTGDLSGN
jgi:polygalacturonase